MSPRLGLTASSKLAFVSELVLGILSMWGRALPAVPVPHASRVGEATYVMVQCQHDVIARVVTDLKSRYDQLGYDQLGANLRAGC